MRIKKEANLRVDFLGGTLDIPPINLLLPKAYTVNTAIDLKATVELEEHQHDYVQIFSKDFKTEKKINSSEFTKENIHQNNFEHFSFIARILDIFEIKSNLNINLCSQSPTGAGLGGSSTIALALYAALCQYKKKKFEKEIAIKKISEQESAVLAQGPCGFQDYYPALYGGVLALESVQGNIKVTSFHSPSLNSFLEENIILAYSGQSRISGINNWEVYKKFFDKDSKVCNGLEKIALLSHNGVQELQNENYIKFLEIIKEEGHLRSHLFENILSHPLAQFKKHLKKLDSKAGMKVCGAGGGGCFLVTNYKNKEAIIKLIQDSQMENLNFSISNQCLE